MSFSQLSLRRLRALAPDLRSVMLFERVPLRFRDGSLPEGVAIAGPSIEIVRAHPRYVERSRTARPPGPRLDGRRPRRHRPVPRARRRGDHHQPAGPGARDPPPPPGPPERPPGVTRWTRLIPFRPGSAGQPAGSRQFTGTTRPPVGRRQHASRHARRRRGTAMSTGADPPVWAGPSTPVTLRVPHERTGVRLARHALADQMDAAGISGVERDDAILVLSELVSNSVKHAAALPSGEIAVRWALGPDEVHLEITDGGAATMPRAGIAALVRAGRARSGDRAHDLPPLGRGRGRARCHRVGRRAPSGRRAPGPRRRLVSRGTCPRPVRSTATMGKKSARRRPTQVPAGAPGPDASAADVPVVAGREPCPCGSGRRYKACHGRAAGAAAEAFVARPFEGLPGECDWVALREIVPAATAELRLTGESAGRAATLATVLPLAWPGLVRQDGAVFVGLQVPGGSGDASRDVARRARAGAAGRAGYADRAQRPARRRPAAAGPARPGRAARGPGPPAASTSGSTVSRTAAPRSWPPWSGPTRPWSPRCG